MDTTAEGAGGSLRRVGIVGAGAMGCSLAVVLGQSLEVVLVVRDPRRAGRIAADGIELRGLGAAGSRPAVVPSIADLEIDGPLDMVFVATKTTAIDAVSEELRPLLRGPPVPSAARFVVSFQNGIEPARRLIERLEHPGVLRMVLNYGARLVDDRMVEILFSRPPHAIGSLNPAHRPACASLAEMLGRGGMETRVADDIERLVWYKGVLNAAMNPVSALTNGTVGEVLDSPARQIVARLLDEGLRVAEAERIGLDADVRHQMWSALEAARAHTPSMVRDIRDGRPSEVGQLNQQIIEHAARVGVPAPTHELITALIDAFDWRVFHAQPPTALGPIAPILRPVPRRTPTATSADSIET